MASLSDFERAVLDKLLAGDHPTLATLRQQARDARVARRKNTGAGFFCDFRVEVEDPVVPANFHIGDVLADVDGLAHGAGVMLFIRNGRLNMLEGYTYDEPWPEEIRDFSLRYSDPDRKAELSKLG
jgi:hypothetical protein